MPFSRSVILVHGRFGALCNRMFTFANLIAFAEKHCLRLINPGFGEFGQAFPAFRGDPLCSYPLRPPSRRVLTVVSRSCQSAAARTMTKGLRRLSPSRCINLGDQGVLDLSRLEDPVVTGLIARRVSVVSGLYFIDHGGFVESSDTIRRVFRPSGVIQEEVSRALDRVRNDGSVVVGVHMRQGDYKEFGGGLYFYTTEEYVDVMRRVRKLVPGRETHFLVCSDAPQSAAALVGVSATFGPGSAVADLYSLAQCDYIIGPPSTFSQWASFYGQVPRFVLNWKCEDHYGCARTPLELVSFNVHREGFGKH